jgi:peptide/nickel transport system permease protein
MTGYIVRRILQLLPVLLIASAGIWAMIYAVPGTPIGAIVGENATAEQIQAAIERFGLDQPVLVQFWSWLKSAVLGDLGRSIHSRDPVLDLILQRAPATLQLGLAATLVGLILGVPVAIVSALYPGSWIDRSLSGWSALALGVPTFWLGILLILLFSVQLRWLPSASAYVSIFDSPWGAVRNVFLPALTLGTYVSGIFARFLRASLLSEMKSDYVRTARSKGLKERDVVGRAPSLRHRGRADDGGLHRRDGGDRGGVHLPRYRPAADPGDHPARLPADPGRDPVHPGRPRRHQPDGRRALRLHRPQDRVLVKLRPAAAPESGRGRARRPA